VELESSDPTSPLSIFRKALALRGELIAPEELTWHETGNKHVLHFSRPNGWHCITNFGNSHYDFLSRLPAKAEILHSSQPLTAAGLYLIHGQLSRGNDLPPAATVWVRV
jgi:alpha-glucosidase